jgi:hypothetical protein
VFPFWVGHVSVVGSAARHRCPSAYGTNLFKRAITTPELAALLAHASVASKGAYSAAYGREALEKCDRLIVPLGKAIGLTAMVALSAFAQPQLRKGLMPSVAISGTSVDEVHQGSYGIGSLWYRSARIQADGTVICSPKAIQYDNYGGRPSVAVSGNNVMRSMKELQTVSGPFGTERAQHCLRMARGGAIAPTV